MESVIIVRYGEIFLKSEPVLNLYVKKLKDNIKMALKREKIKAEITRHRGRLFVRTKQAEKACQVLQSVFGIVSFSPAKNLKTDDMKKLQGFCKKNFAKWIEKKQTFAVRAKRTGNQKYTSMELAKAIGDVIDRKVDLNNPDVTVGIEARDGESYVFTETIKGLGGLPVSCSGKVICLISGGIDSPVSAWQMMKRGCATVLLHFHSFPLVSKASIQKTKDLTKVLSRYQPWIKLYLVPFQKIQTEIKNKVLDKYRIVLYRRFMLRIAEEIAKQEKAKAIVTGESLAQVSSQTLDNMVVISEAVDTLLLRPLLSFDKMEIVELAKRVGTFEISIKPQEDCCTLFTPKHPTTKARIEDVKKFEKKLSIKKLVSDAVKKTELVKI